MGANERVIAALEAALENEPGDPALTAHLAGLLLSDDRASEALACCRAALERAPADRALLGLAARAAEASGEGSADGYRALLGALGEGEAPAASDPAPAPDPSPAPDPAPDPAPAPPVVPLRAIDGGRPDDDGDGPARFERPEVTLADVGGLEGVKRKLNTAFLGPLRRPELRQAYGKSLRGGLLLYGPPGCGKTFIARALAGEIGARFSSIGISDVLDMWVGESERKLHELFEAARRNAPCVLFLDEVDALGQKRSHLRHSGVRGTVNQLLAELDSAGSSNEGVFVLAATNHPWDVDTALRRPGRLDRMVLVLPPDPPAREAILRTHLAGRPVQEALDLRPVVERTEGYSGADLAYVCELATEAALEESLETDVVRPVGPEDLRRGVKETSPSTRAWFDVAYNYAMFANEGGLYDELLDYVKAHKLR
jgi:AAA+ superfamily predicted ATPase